MTDAVMLERIAARRTELDVLEEELVKRLAEVRSERDELVVAERVVQRISEQGFGEYLSLAAAPLKVQVGGRSVLLIPVCAGGAGPEVLPADYQQILVIVQQAAGPVKVEDVGAVLGQYVTERHSMAAMIEPTYRLYREVIQDASCSDRRRNGARTVRQCAPRGRCGGAAPERQEFGIPCTAPTLRGLGVQSDAANARGIRTARVTLLYSRRDRLSAAVRSAAVG